MKRFKENRLAFFALTFIGALILSVSLVHVFTRGSFEKVGASSIKANVSNVLSD